MANRMSLAGTRNAIKILPRYLLFIGMAMYILFGISTSKVLVGIEPPSVDWAIYQRAAHDVHLGYDPYADRHVGTAFLYPPPALLLFEWLSGISPLQFALLNLILCLLLVGSAAYYYQVSRSVFMIWMGLVTASVPLFETLYVGQVSFLIAISLALAFLWERDHPCAAGLILALGILLKVTPVLFLLYFLVQRNWKAIAVTLTVCCVACVIAGLRYGTLIFATYFAVFVNLSSTFLTSSGNPQGLAGKLTFLGLVSNPADFQKAFLLLVGVIVAVSAIQAWRSRETVPLFVVLCIGIVLTPNVLWYHHYVVLLMPLLIWMAWSGFDPLVILACALAFWLVNTDRWTATSGLLIQGFGLTLLVGMAVWQYKSGLNQVLCDLTRMKKIRHDRT